MLAGLAVFLIHNLIDFSMFEIGPMMLFMLVGGAVLGVRSPSAAGLASARRSRFRHFASAWRWLVALIFIAILGRAAECAAESRR